ncbi:MAG TPA: hypothetical protein VFU47_07820, partial [Armatimonadota bacterium]|nr:hypothetical protein [Armatimonadota bacterium]
MAFTKLLTIYLSAGVVVLLAWVLNAPRLYWMAGVLVLLPWASRLLARRETRGLEVTRDLPAAGHQGETVRVRLRLRNRSRAPKLHLSVLDNVPPGLSRPGAEPLPVHLAPLGEDTLEYPLRLARRGLHTLPSLHVESTDMLGISSRQAELDVSSRILVYPRV